MNPNPTKTYNIETVAYTKKNGDSSEREVVVITNPSTNVLVVQVDGLSATDRERLTNLLHKHREEMAALMKETGAQFKTFIPDNLEFLTRAKQKTMKTPSLLITKLFEVNQLIYDLGKQGKTVCVDTHDMQQNPEGVPIPKIMLKVSESY